MLGWGIIFFSCSLHCPHLVNSSVCQELSMHDRSHWMAPTWLCYWVFVTSGVHNRKALHTKFWLLFWGGGYCCPWKDHLIAEAGEVNRFCLRIENTCCFPRAQENSRMSQRERWGWWWTSRHAFTFNPWHLPQAPKTQQAGEFRGLPFRQLRHRSRAWVMGFSTLVSAHGVLRQHGNLRNYFRGLKRGTYSSQQQIQPPNIII